MLAQRRRRWPSITSAFWPMYRVFWRRDVKGHHHNAAVTEHCTITHCCFNDGPASKTVDYHWLNVTCLRKVYNGPGVLSQRRRRLTGMIQQWAATLAKQ